MNVLTGASLALAFLVGGCWALGVRTNFGTFPAAPVAVSRPAFGSQRLGVVIGLFEPLPPAREPSVWREWHRLRYVRAPVADAAGRPVAVQRAIVVPHWLAAASFAALPAAWLAGRCGRVLSRRHAGRCAACGYDVRASPERCPECGTEAATGSPHNQPLQRTGDANGYDERQSARHVAGR